MSTRSPRHVASVVGLGIGLVLGLVYTWAIAPVELVNTYPALLRTDYRHGWVRLTALSYVVDGDLERARARLDGLKQEDVALAMQALIEEYAAAGRSADSLRSLTALARALDVHTSAMLVYLYTPTPLPRPSLSSPSSTPLPTSVPTLTRTPTLRPSPSVTPPIPEPTLVSTPVQRSVSPLATTISNLTSTPSSPTPTPPLLARLQLADQEQICEPGQRPQVQVVVTDERGVGISGVEVWLMWPGGADRAVTGLKPRGGAGYVDFDAEPGTSYVLGVGELGVPLVTSLRIEPCPLDEEDGSLMGSWRIVFTPRPLDTPEPERDAGG